MRAATFYRLVLITHAMNMQSAKTPTYRNSNGQLKDSILDLEGCRQLQ